MSGVVFGMRVAWADFEGDGLDEHWLPTHAPKVNLPTTRAPFFKGRGAAVAYQDQRPCPQALAGDAAQKLGIPGLHEDRDGRSSAQGRYQDWFQEERGEEGGLAQGTRSHLQQVRAGLVWARVLAES